jgi:hypothetical protein
MPGDLDVPYNGRMFRIDLRRATRLLSRDAGDWTDRVSALAVPQFPKTGLAVSGFSFPICVVFTGDISAEMN